MFGWFFISFKRVFFSSDVTIQSYYFVPCTDIEYQTIYNDLNTLIFISIKRRKNNETRLIVDGQADNFQKANFLKATRPYKSHALCTKVCLYMRSLNKSLIIVYK